MKSKTSFSLRRSRSVLFAALALFGATAAFGRTLPQDLDDPVVAVNGSAIETLWQGGAIGIADREARDLFVGLEARLRPSWHGIRPWAGLTLVDSGAWFSGAGLIYDIELTPRMRLTLGSGPFYYADGNRGWDLGYDLEFYSFAELTWQWRRDLRLGFRVGHLSNAGLGRRNPGTETLGLVVSIPLDRLVAGNL
ncbi:MAG: acyloxyacyl hydrolase [Opitutus sp.]|nr:acyloxyacyl hydrolase [Opitutus sp.]